MDWFSESGKIAIAIIGAMANFSGYGGGARMLKAQSQSGLGKGGAVSDPADPLPRSPVRAEIVSYA